jgi:Mg-chelatase subunit ChlD
MGTAKKNTRAENTTLLVLVVDRSGSMESIRDDMEGGIKTLLDEQAKEKGACLVTLAQFDDTYELVVEGVPAAELEPYRLIPRGSTALLDAIGRTIGHVKGRLDGLDPAQRPGEILFAVITDGMENASREWSRMQVMDSVKARISEGWDFTFLGANQDAIQEGRHLGVDPNASLTYEASPTGTREAFSSMSNSMRKKRRGESKSLEFTQEERRRASGE